MSKHTPTPAAVPATIGSLTVQLLGIPANLNSLTFSLTLNLPPPYGTIILDIALTARDLVLPGTGALK